MGHDDEEQADLGGPEGYNFGYPQREWDTFSTGGDLVAALDEEEIRARLRVLRPPLPHDGCTLECAERLLVHQQGRRTPQALVHAWGVEMIKGRLTALGLDSQGTSLECAQRLLFLLENVPLEKLKAWDASEYLRPLQGARQRRRRNRKGKKQVLTQEPTSDTQPIASTVHVSEGRSRVGSLQSCLVAALGVSPWFVLLILVYRLFY